jgi:hypothetical protein
VWYTRNLVAQTRGEIYVRKLIYLLTIFGVGFVRPNDVNAQTTQTCAQPVNDEEQAFVRGANRAFELAKTPTFVRHAFLANAYRESKYQVAQSTPPTAPDHKAGGSHTAYQILKPNLLRALMKLGLSWADVVPNHAALTLAEIERYAEVQTRVALAVSVAMGIRWSLTSPQEPQVLNYFSRWAAGSWSWERVRAHPTVNAILVDGVPSDLRLLRRAADTLAAQKRLISASALYKLLLYRQVAAGCAVAG